jgi:phosphatidylglycerol:prolipoprotein diacylglycerol transferase
VLVAWRGIAVSSYGALLYLGLVTAAVAGSAAAGARGLDESRALLALVLLTAPALVGARLAWQAVHGPSAGRGAAMDGGLALALVVSWPLTEALALPFGAFWDAAAVGALAGSIPVRLGCLLHGCCAGRPTAGRLGLVLAGAGGVRCRRVPAPLLEAAFSAVLLGVLLAVGARLAPGQAFLAALGAYGAGRCLLGFARERARGEGAVTLGQAFGLAWVAVAATGLAAA